MKTKSDDSFLEIGSLAFDGLDQIDLTGPFEVLSRLPHSRARLYALHEGPVRDVQGLRLQSDATIDDAPALDVLHVPGGPGQEEVMDDSHLLNWLREQAAGATAVFSVCTGALLLGAAGLLIGRQATTHWGSFHLLSHFGALPVDERVVVDGGWVFAAGVTAGLDGALRLAAELRGRRAAEEIQLGMAYAPEPPFASGKPETAPPEVLQAVQERTRALTARREQTAARFAASLRAEQDTNR